MVLLSFGEIVEHTLSRSVKLIGCADDSLGLGTGSDKNSPIFSLALLGLLCLKSSTEWPQPVPEMTQHKARTISDIH